MDPEHIDQPPSEDTSVASAPNQHAEFNLNGAQIKVEMKAPQGTRLDLRVHAHLPGRILPSYRRVEMGPVSPFSARLSMIWSRLNRPQSAFLAAVLIYLLVRLVGLVDWPIYFFSDEAVQTVLAADFLRDGLRNWTGELLPTFFQNSDKYSLGVSVYLQVLPYMMFGKSMWVTRAVCVLVSLLAALAVGEILRKAFRLSMPWAGILLLSATPAWFLHSRTAFETGLAVSFFAGFLYFYLSYRLDKPLPALFYCVLLGGLAFYTYPPVRLVLAACVLLLGVSDWRYHWQQRKVVLKALGLAALLALPYLRFTIQHPGENRAHLELLGSYWVDGNTSLRQKLGSYFQEYVKGLDPTFWFLPLDEGVQVRHVMKGYGHLLRVALPFYLLGLGLCLREIRRPQERAVLIALLAAPAGAAMAGMGVTRALVMVVPATILAAMGLDAAVNWLIPRLPNLARKGLAPIVFLLLAGTNIYMLANALTNGPTWFADYGLSGMQYGARQLFGELVEVHQESPETKLVVSPNWTNGADLVARFFFDDPFPLELASVDTWLYAHHKLTEEMLFVLPPAEYQKAVDSAKFKTVKLERTLPYPNGEPGFYFVRLQYADNIDQILADEEEERKKPVQDELVIENQLVWVTHSRLDMGSIQDVFDDDPESLARSQEANPLRIVLDFPQERTLNGLTLRVGSTETWIGIRVVDEQGRELAKLEKLAEETVQVRDVRIDFDQPLPAARLEIQVKNAREGEPSHVHIWEVALQ